MRNKWYSLWVPAWIFIILTGLIFSAEAPKKESEEDAVKTTLVVMWAAIERGDVKAYAAFLHRDFSAFGETDTYLAEGKRLEVRNVAGWLKHAKGVHTEMHHPNVTVKGKVAWITYYWTDSGISDGKPFSSRGKSTRIFVKENGKWLCIHGHYTSVK